MKNCRIIKERVLSKNKEVFLKIYPEATINEDKLDKDNIIINYYTSKKWLNI